MTRLRGPIATPGQSILFGIPVALIGLVFCVVGGVYGMQSVTDLSGMRHASGSVIRLEQHGSSYQPVVQFTAESGRQVTFTDAIGSNPSAHKAGDTVNVVYPPDRPKEAKIYSPVTIVFQIGSPFACAAFFLITGGAMISSGISRRRARVSS